MQLFLVTYTFRITPSPTLIDQTCRSRESFNLAESPLNTVAGPSVLMISLSTSASEIEGWPASTNKCRRPVVQMQVYSCDLSMTPFARTRGIPFSCYSPALFSSSSSRLTCSPELSTATDHGSKMSSSLVLTTIGRNSLVLTKSFNSQLPSSFHNVAINARRWCRGLSSLTK